MPSARALTPLAIASLLMSLAACDRPEEPTVAASAPPTAADAGPAAPNLWRIEVLDGEKIVQSLDICADLAVQQSFSRPTPEIGGRPCVRVGEAVETDGTYSVRCRSDEQLYRVGAAVQGDPAKDFTVEMAVTMQDRKGPTFEQVRRYRLTGPCPAGWAIGDSAAPGTTQVTNTLTGEARTVAAASE